MYTCQSEALHMHILGILNYSDEQLSERRLSARQVTLLSVAMDITRDCVYTHGSQQYICYF